MFEVLKYIHETIAERNYVEYVRYYRVQLAAMDILNYIAFIKKIPKVAHKKAEV